MKKATLISGMLWPPFTKTGNSILKSVSINGVCGDYTLEQMLLDKDGGHCMRFTDLNRKCYIRERMI